MKLFSFLKSRRLAAVLLVGMTVYAWVSTLVPLESVDPVAVARWDAEHPLLAVLVQALGMHRAFSSPAFLLAAALLTASTAACAWERTAWALRGWRARGKVTEGLRERLMNAPSFTIPLPSSDRDRDLQACAEALRGMRLRVRRGPQVVEGGSANLGLFGSPVFHWSLAALFLFAGLGQLTRYEGFANVVAGDVIEDAPSSYGSGYYAGPLSPGASSGLKIGVLKIEPGYKAGGVDRGTTPLVRLSRGDTQIAEQWVYPNAPLQYGPFVIHRAQVGRALVGTLREGGRQERLVLYYPPGAQSAAFTLPPIGTSPTSTITMAAAAGQRVVVSIASGSVTETRTIGVREPVRLSAAASMTVDALTGYAQLKVVNDWSVPWIYAMFVIGTVAAATTVFVHPRTVRILWRGDEDGMGTLHVLVTRAKTDPAFPRAVERALRASLLPASSPEKEAS